MGKLTKTLLILGTLMVLLVGVRVIVMVTHPEDDKALIKEALAESIKASKEGRPGGVMDKLSANVSFNGQSGSGYERDIARYIRASKPDVEVENIDPVVTGDEAVIVSPVNVKGSLLGQTMTKHVKEVTIVFKKEEDRDYLLFPSHHWKLSEVKAPNLSLSDFGSQ